MVKNTIKQFGEVFTPPELVNEMLDKLPVELWFDKDKTWLDPACGSGNFLVEVKARLMASLKEQIPNDDDREKHILENMIYGVEIQKDVYEECKKRLDPDNKYNLNIANEDALKYDYSFDGTYVEYEQGNLFESLGMDIDEDI